MSCYRQTMIVPAVALLLHACASSQPPAPSTIGLGLERLRIGMTKADAQAAYPALTERGGFDNFLQLELPPYQWEGCSFYVAVDFVNDRLQQINVGADAKEDDSCKVTVLREIAKQYGPPQKGEPLYAFTIYMVKNTALEVDVMDTEPKGDTSALAELGYLRKGMVGPFGDVSPGSLEMGRIFGVVFRDPKAGIILVQ